MAIVKDTIQLAQAQSMAATAANVAHEAQPYPQEGEMFKGLARLGNALSAAALRCLEDSLIVEPEAPCATCGQTDIGQAGEYPCPTCSLPQVHAGSPADPALPIWQLLPLPAPAEPGE